MPAAPGLIKGGESKEQRKGDKFVFSDRDRDWVAGRLGGDKENVAPHAKDRIGQPGPTRHVK